MATCPAQDFNGAVTGVINARRDPPTDPDNPDTAFEIRLDTPIEELGRPQVQTAIISKRAAARYGRELLEGDKVSCHLVVGSESTHAFELRPC